MKTLVVLIAFVLIMNVNSFRNPTQSGIDSPDPGVIRDRDGTYYSVTTG